MCMVFSLVFSWVTMEEDFDIKTEQCALIHFFHCRVKVWKKQLTSYVMFTLKMNYCWHLPFTNGIKPTGKGGKVSPCRNRVDDQSVKSHKLLWIRSVWWSGKTGIWLFEIWSTWRTFPRWPFALSLHKISELMCAIGMGIAFAHTWTNGNLFWNFWGVALGTLRVTRFVCKK